MVLMYESALDSTARSKPAAFIRTAALVEYTSGYTNELERAWYTALLSATISVGAYGVYL